MKSLTVVSTVKIEVHEFVMLKEQGYRIRTKAEEYHFFKQGRVFAILRSEPTGEIATSSRMTENSQSTAHPMSGVVEGRFGQKIYCQIRRFVVMRVNKHEHFVETWYVFFERPRYSSNYSQCHHHIWEPRGSGTRQSPFRAHHRIFARSSATIRCWRV